MIEKKKKRTMTSVMSFVVPIKSGGGENVQTYLVHT